MAGRRAGSSLPEGKTSSGSVKKSLDFHPRTPISAWITYFLTDQYRVSKNSELVQSDSAFLESIL